METTNKSINYPIILKNAWQISWRNKFLWLFGFLISAGASIFNINYSFNENSNMPPTVFSKEEFFLFLEKHWEWMVPGGIIFLFLILIFSILRIISIAGIIASLSDIQKKQPAGFKKGFREGKKYFWRILAVNLIFGFSILGISIVLFLPVFFLFYIKSFPLGIFLALLAIIIFVPILTLFAFIKKYAYFYLVLSNLSLGAALENGYRIFAKNWMTSLLTTLIIFAIEILAVFLLILSILILAIPLIIVGIIIYFISPSLLVAIAILAGILFLTAIILARSILETFYQSVWFLFFYEIAKIKKEKEDKVKEVEMEVAKKKIPDPESA